MKVILISRVINLGNIGDIVNVRDGYGKNFLIPQKKAIFYSVANYKVFETKKQQFEVENQNNSSSAHISKQKLDGKTIIIVGNASDDGRLYGSVTTATVASKVNEILGSKSSTKPVSRIDIILKKPIKDVGVHDVRVDLYSDIYAKMQVVVGKSESEAAVIISALKEQKDSVEVRKPEELLEKSQQAVKSA